MVQVYDSKFMKVDIIRIGTLKKNASIKHVQGDQCQHFDI